MRIPSLLLTLAVLSLGCQSNPPAPSESAIAATQPVATKLTFLGVAAATPAAGEDTASFIINDTLLIDCGWNAALRMLDYGYNPAQIDTLFFTHCHHDHYLGLPGILFYRGLGSNAKQVKAPLNIVGPPDDMPLVVEAAQKFLQDQRFPIHAAVNLHKLEPGQTVETPAWRIQTVKSLHGVTGVCSRFTDKKTGVVIAFTGDTAPNAAFLDLCRGADLLIHEASLSPRVSDAQMASHTDHSRALDAARLAREAGVKQLILIHAPAAHRAASVEAARQVFPNTRYAAQGQTLTLSR